jgi:hypothetical protein
MRAISPARIARSLVTVLVVTLLQVVAAPVLAPQLSTPSAQAADANDFPTGLGTVYQFLADSYTSGSTTWPEARGGTAATISNTATKVTNTAGTLGASKSIVAVQGTVNTVLTFPTTIGPGTSSNYTFIYVARYAPISGSAYQAGNYCDTVTHNAGTDGKSRIFTSGTGNWLSGFWACAAGVAFHEAWITDSANSVTELGGNNGNNWLLGTDCGYTLASTSACKGRFRAFGTDRTVIASTSTGTHQVGVHIGTYGGEQSDYQIAEVISYPTILQVSDIVKVETYLARKYGITLSATAATKLGVLRSSVGTNLNEPLSLQPQIAIQDANGQTVTTDNSTIVTATVTGLNGKVIGTATADAIQGVATFDNLGVDGLPGNSYTITYSSSAGHSSTSETRTFTRGGSSETDTAMSFNGTSHYLRAPDANSLDISDSITVQAWVFQTASIGTGWNMVVNKENAYELGTIAGTWWYGLQGQGGSWSGVDTKVPSKLNEWQHIAFTRAAGSAQVNFYLNGNLVFTGSADGVGTGLINNSLHTLTISGRDFGNGSIASYFQGQIDELRIYASNRTQQQILSDMNSYGPVNTSSLRLYYDFNEGSGSTIYNRVAGALAESDLTRYNSTPWDESRIMASTTNGPYSVRTFNRSYLTSVGGWKAPRTVRSSILTVAGGGGGGSRHAGGGGGGGVSYAPTYLLTAASAYEIQVGVGGIGYGQPGNNPYLSGTTFVTSAGGNSNGSGTSGKNSILRPTNILESITAIGGGGGGGVGVAGGSGGGSNGSSSSPGAAIGYSTPFFTAYGNAGGFGYSGPACGLDYCGGGGGGAGSAGGIPLTAGSAATDRAGNGGDGLPFSTSAQTATYYGGGGGGGAFNSGLDSVGGLGGGAAGGRDSEGAHGTYALGGGGGGGGFNGMTSYRGGNGGSGVIVIRWITATAPTFTPPVIAYLNAGMTETFTTNVAQDSATAMLTRTFRWESSTTGVSGTYSVIKQGTGASNAFFSWVPSDTSTSGSTFAYRVVVTDSDTAGLFIVETSTPVWAIINRPLNVAGSSSFAKAINLAKSETYTITLGTSTYRSTLSPVIPGITLDTSTAGLAVIRIAETVTVGTYYETLTVTDSVSAVVILPLTINVSAPPTLLNSSEIVSNNLILHLDAGNSQSLIAADTTTVTSTLWRDLSGNGKHGQTTGTGTFNGGSCSAPTYYRDFGGYLKFSGSGQCYWVPYLGTHARNSISVEAWFRSPTTTIAAGAALFGQAYPISSQNIDISLGSADSALTSFAIGVYNGASTTWQRSGGYTPTINTWTHLVGTYDGNNFRIYANGSLVVTTANTNSTSLLAGDENLSGYFIGRRFDGTNSYTGDMASIRVYDAPLTLGQVQQNYNATKERFLSSNINMLRLTQKYGAKQEETFTVTSGFGSKTRVLSTGNRTGIAWDTATANTVVLAIQESLTVGTYSDTITVTDSLNQSSFLPITMSIAKADTITVTVRNSKTFVYTGSAPTSLPDITITGLVSSDTGTATRLFSAPASRVGAPETYTALVNSSSVPIDVETYTVTAATPVLSVGSLSNYEGVLNNETTTLQITQANQQPLRIAMYGASVGSPYTITTDGGSGGGLVTETTTAGSTASNCLINSRVLTMTSTVSSYCNILVTKAATRNFRVETATAQITFFLFVPTASAPTGGGPGIGIGGIKTVTVDAVGAPTINSLSATTISLSAGGSLTISGSGFGSSSLTVKFWRDKSVTITPSNGSTIVVPVADIAAAGGQSGRITVITVGGAAVSVERLTITP